MFPARVPNGPDALPQVHVVQDALAPEDLDS